jgi:hypothetical protein
MMRNERGKLEPNYDECLEYVISGCFLDFSSSSTDDTGRTQEQTVVTLYTPPNLHFERFDRVEYMGQIYQVDSKPFVHKSPNGKLDHLSIRLKIQEG